MEFNPTDEIIIGNPNFDKNSLKDGETATITLPIISLSVGNFHIIEGDLNYKDSGVDKTIPFTIQSSTK